MVDDNDNDYIIDEYEDAIASANDDDEDDFDDNTEVDDDEDDVFYLPLPQMSPDVSLPQFDVLGHRQRIVEASLSSGNYSRYCMNAGIIRIVDGLFLFKFFILIF